MNSNTISQIDVIRRILRPNERETSEVFTHYPIIEKCNAIENYMKANNPKFDLEFTYKIHDYFLANRSLSQSQEAGIDNIIKKFKIDVTEWA